MFAKEPVRGGPAPAGFITVGGIERVNHQIRYGPRPPIYYLSGLRPVTADGHRTEFQIPATEWLVGPSGRIDAMACAYLGDGPVGMAVMITTEPGRVTTTAELSLIFHDPTRPGSGQLSGKGYFLSSNETTGVAACRIEHGDQLLASGITRMAYLDYPIPEGLTLEPEEAGGYDGPNPYERAVQGHPIPNRKAPGLDLEQARISDADLSPIEHLFGLRPLEAAAGYSVLGLTLSGWHMSPAGNLYGGTMAAAVTAAVEAAARTLAHPGHAERALDVKINYVRPVDCDGRELRLVATVVHGGRRLVVVRVEAIRADGKVAAYGQGTAALEVDVRHET